ncbi:MAG: hypothetical protein II788_00730 [Acholeplasmatales bacterium]|nr:hypothetical protein [Acholeplasmatales bacterium]
MKQKALKLILSGAASLALAVSLTATTFAYVLIGNNVVVEEFDFEVEGQEGLLISLDGENFSQDITSEQLKIAIAGSVEEFDKNRIIGTTVKHYLGNAVVDQNGLNFTKEIIDYDITTDTYSRNFKGAIPNKDYIKFDLWFKALNTKTTATNFELSFGERTYISAPTSEVELYNSFNTYTQNAQGKYEKTSYTQGMKLKQNVANAMRMGIYNEDETNKLSVYEVVDDDDLGSAAIEGKIDAKHDPYSSIMINYYNVLFPRYPFSNGTLVDDKLDTSDNKLKHVEGAEDGEAFNTKSNYGTKDAQGNWNGQRVGSFTTQDTLKITVYIWLEGWDADYLIGTTVEGAKLKCGLEFNLAEV